MQEISYPLTSQAQQGTKDCAQANLSLLLSHYNIHKSVEDITAAVPVYVNTEGKSLGSSVGHIASYALDLGLKATLHVSDVQLFDQSWSTLSADELCNALVRRVPYIHHGTYDTETLHVIADGFVQFLRKGGTIVTPVVDEHYIHTQLVQGPLFFIVNYQYAFQRPRTNYTEEVKSADPITGSLSTHVVTITGYKDGQFQVVDTVREPEHATVWVPANRLIAAYHLADIDLDSMFLTLSKD